MHPRNSHARYARRAADALGWAFASLDGDDAYVFEVRDGDRARVFACATATPYVENPAAAYTVARDKHFTALALARAGVPHLPGRLYFASARGQGWRTPGRERADLLREAPQIGFPFFCKPVAGSRGEFAQQIDDAAALERYLDAVGAQHDAVLLQPVVQAPECRVFVHRGQALFWYDKTLPATGGAARPRNRAQGGRSGEPRTEVPAPLADCAVAAARALGLQLAGVDLFRGPDGPRVIEVNANPMIETLEDWGRWDLIERIWIDNLRAALA